MHSWQPVPGGHYIAVPGTRWAVLVGWDGMGGDEVPLRHLLSAGLLCSQKMFRRLVLRGGGGGADAVRRGLRLPARIVRRDQVPLRIQVLPGLGGDVPLPEGDLLHGGGNEPDRLPAGQGTPKCNEMQREEK